tara:strand:+ start:40 stop:177 length:138 start_codon:yes stop_codon:yes gene_type:complete
MIDFGYLKLIKFSTLSEFFSSEDIAPKALTGESSGGKSKKRKVFS